MFLQYDFRQRKYDGKWERLGKIKDVEHSYSYKTASGQTITLVPEKWITIGVYDYLAELEG